MIGAIAGDISGSVYERTPIKSKDFPFFCEHSRYTDDTVLTVAVADAILNNGDYVSFLKNYARRYPDAGYGYSFYSWMMSDENGPYNSWGNGSAMRVSPVGFAFDTEVEVLSEAKRSAAVTHNHPEGIKGAQAVALSIYMARIGEGRTVIRDEVARRFGYDLNRSLSSIRPGYEFDVSCGGSVPESIISFIESEDYEDSVRNAISLGGDSDTMACISGGIAQAYYGDVPDVIKEGATERIPPEFIAVINRFDKSFLS
ncbi:MAG: ADP-ribosylglycohydrolase family protein [Nitrospirota bacterium]|nr:MAG: ADP-ribosylglycohydrolase family protein [Nitrospirota bacterium]